MMNWSRFDKAMREAEWLYSKNKLPYSFMKALKDNGCWRDNEPFCSYNDFTYKMSEKQINAVYSEFLNCKKS